MKNIKEKTLRISPDLHFQLREYAILKGLKIQCLANKIIANWLKKKNGKN